MIWAYNWKEYKIAGVPRTSIWRPLWDRCVFDIFFEGRSNSELNLHVSIASTTVRPAHILLSLYHHFSLPRLTCFSIADFAIEIWGSLKFFWDYYTGKPQTHGPRTTIYDADGKARPKMNYAEAFGFDNGNITHRAQVRNNNISNSGSGYDGYNGRSESNGTRQRPSYDENIRLAPYTYGANQQPSAENLARQQHPNAQQMGYAYAATPPSSSSEVDVHSQYPPDPKAGWAR